MTKKGSRLIASITSLRAENRVVPLAIMVTRNEIGENWHLFMKALKPYIINHPRGKLTFISDRQKGLLETITELFPDHNQRYCFRHMYANFKKYYKGTKLHQLVCNAALCYKERHWKVHMDELVKLSSAAA